MILNKDLRIGNYVHEKDYGFIEVETIDNRDGAMNFYKDPYGYQQGGIIRPIKLTKEWLSKFGFSSVFTSDPQKENASKAYKLNGLIVHQPYEEEDIFIVNLCNDIDVKSVHQLQNLYFAVTGEDLIIKTKTWKL